MEKTYDLDPGFLSLDQRIAAVRDAERDIARIHARQLRLIAAIDADECGGALAPELDKQFVKEELRAALGESGVSVGNRIDLARELVDRLPLAMAALAAGEITLRHVRLLTDASALLDDSAATAVEAACVSFAFAIRGRRSRRLTTLPDVLRNDNPEELELADNRNADVVIPHDNPAARRRFAMCARNDNPEDQEPRA
jgi:hypothetical protein